MLKNNWEDKRHVETQTLPIEENVNDQEITGKEFEEKRKVNMWNIVEEYIK